MKTSAPLKRVVRRLGWLVGGLVWLTAACAIATLLVDFLSRGAGEAGLAFLIPGSMRWVGLLEFVGLVSAAALCFVVGVGLCARGVVGPASTSVRPSQTSRPG
ncbi:MAG: hypothetical protein JNN07_14615 [Verrucomicrobiales bacterium]|nr:hypothetical protein [Verrucomicrobiales bacterium]